MQVKCSHPYSSSPLGQSGMLLQRMYTGKQKAPGQRKCVIGQDEFSFIGVWVKNTLPWCAKGTVLYFLKENSTSLEKIQMSYNHFRNSKFQIPSNIYPMICSPLSFDGEINYSKLESQALAKLSIQKFFLPLNQCIVCIYRPQHRSLFSTLCL